MNELNDSPLSVVHSRQRKLPRSSAGSASPDPEVHVRLQQAFGYTNEDMKLLLAPMASEGKWPIGSMGEEALDWDQTPPLGEGPRSPLPREAGAAKL